MTATHHRRDDLTEALRTAHDNLADLTTIPWPHDPIPEILARAEALLAVLPLVPPDSPAAEHILTTVRTDGRALAEVDSFGLLHGPIRARYLAAIVSAAPAPELGIEL